MDEILTAREVAGYLKVNERTVLKLAGEGQLPGVKVGGQWRFKTRVLDRWLEDEMTRTGTSKAASDLGQANGMQLATLLRPELIIPQLSKTDAEGILEELVDVAARAGYITRRDQVLTAVHHRERMCTTAIGNGVALPHPRPCPGDGISRSFVALGRSVAGVDFGALDGEPTHLFFLVCADETPTHLKILGRLSRLVSLGGVVEALRQAADADTIHRVFAATELTAGTNGHEEEPANSEATSHEHQ